MCEEQSAICSAIDAGAFFQPRRHFVRDRAGHGKIIDGEKNRSPFAVAPERECLGEEMARHALGIRAAPAVAVQPHRIIWRDVDARDTDLQERTIGGGRDNGGEQRREYEAVQEFHGDARRFQRPREQVNSTLRLADDSKAR